LSQLNFELKSNQKFQVSKNFKSAFQIPNEAHNATRNKKLEIEDSPSSNTQSICDGVTINCRHYNTSIVWERQRKSGTRRHKPMINSMALVDASRGRMKQQV